MTATKQRALDMITEMPDEKVEIVIGYMVNLNGSAVQPDELTREQKKARFMHSAGKIEIDADAVRELRERSII